MNTRTVDSASVVWLAIATACNGRSSEFDDAVVSMDCGLAIVFRRGNAKSNKKARSGNGTRTAQSGRLRTKGATGASQDWLAANSRKLVAVCESQSTRVPPFIAAECRPRRALFERLLRALEVKQVIIAALQCHAQVLPLRRQFASLRGRTRQPSASTRSRKTEALKGLQ